MPKVIYINAERKTVQMVDVVCVKNDLLNALQSMVGGYVERVPYMEKMGKNNLLVDEEGLFKGYKYGFVMDGHTFMGNGVISTLSMKDAFKDVNEVGAIGLRIRFK